MFVESDTNSLFSQCYTIVKHGLFNVATFLKEIEKKSNNQKGRCKSLVVIYFHVKKRTVHAQISQEEY